MIKVLTPRLRLIDKCVHCGFCLPTCPTYLLWGEEMDSPRGRIYLMKAGIEGRAEMTTSFVEHFDRCLGCLACVTACPSGVQYAPLIEKSRAQIERQHDRDPGDRLFRAVLMAFIPYPWRMRLALLPLLVFGPLLRRLARGSKPRADAGRSKPEATGGGLLARAAAALALAPPVTWASLVDRLPGHTPAVGSERLKVAMLAGCVQRIAFTNVNHATIRVLSAEGCSVDAPGRRVVRARSLHAGTSTSARGSRTQHECASGRAIASPSRRRLGRRKEYGELSQTIPSGRAVRTHSREGAGCVGVSSSSENRGRAGVLCRPRFYRSLSSGAWTGCGRKKRSRLQRIPGVELLSPAERTLRRKRRIYTWCSGAGGHSGPAKSALAALSPDMIATANPVHLQIAARPECRVCWPIFHPRERSTPR